MSDLERRIQERASLQAQHDNDEAARLALEEQRREAEESVLLERSLKLGREVVDLLQKHDLPSETIWELKFVTEKYTAGSHTSSFYRYDRAGPGWHIYTHIAGDPNNYYDYPRSENHIGISETGKIFTFESYSSADNGRRLDKPQSVRGLVGAVFSEPQGTISTIESEKFQEGLASLIRGEGPRVIKTKNKWD